MNWLKENLFRIAIVVTILLIGGLLLSKQISEISGKWQAVYYPDGCLVCEDDYIFSPFFNTANECINWIHDKAETRKNKSDMAECAFDCKKKDGFLVCEDTLDVLGSPSF